ncbi:class I SAM-dependent methyltransferase [Desemzia sp. RIT804]|uniref:class I SAM-dependent methyltransferase n=1 Tax=Desemzia sp. RIT 804 TaxID=2810209 RepID=UPI00194FC9CE|nr:class I SAM-dependent methyltransferase [Desemzia sp. RIT 804]MBM6613819.1 class I SAM-dependent methyltransferase [Desemzia sp. RIT 804]
MGHIHQFNQLAAKYDTTKNKDMAKRSTDAIRSLLDKNHTKTAIDLGCGTGNVGLDLLEEFESMLFVDASPEMIEQVEKKLANMDTKKASVLCLDIEKDVQLPYKADTIILSLVLHHISDSHKLLSKLYDALNEDGQLLIIEMEKQEEISSGHQHGIDRSVLAAALTEIGYQHIQSDIFYDAKKEKDEQGVSRFILSARKK